MDTTKAEIYDHFKKHGIIANNIDSGEPRISMYAHEDGTFKGEALVSEWRHCSIPSVCPLMLLAYFRPESIGIAILLSDNADIRAYGNGTMRVTAADMSYKKQKEVTAEQLDKTRSRQKAMKDREKIKAMTNKMNAWVVPPTLTRHMH